MIYLGVNTGTSADAVDVVICRQTQQSQKFLYGYEEPIHSELRDRILSAVNNAKISYQDIKSLGSELAKIYQEAVKQACLEAKIALTDIEAIGLHGQTIHHCPIAQVPYTLQLDHAADVSQGLGVNVVADFRAQDIAQGGQGAPIIPAYHRYLAQSSQEQRAAFINLGGIANITWFDEGRNNLLGWDIGPANALLDNWIFKNKSLNYDMHGKWAQSGNVSTKLLKKLTDDPYFSLPPPKSTGRDYFNLTWLEKFITDEKPEDIQATLVELTAQQIAKALDWCACEVTQDIPVYMYGKGVENSYVMAKIQSYCKRFIVKKSDEISMPSQWLEGGLYAWLAHCYTQKNTINLTKVTGSRGPVILGAMYYGKLLVSS